MHLRDLQRNWQRMGAEDPLWAVATAPQYKNGAWDEQAFYATGETQVDEIMTHARTLGLSAIFVGHALDFGCGVGRLSHALGRHFDRVTGVDIAPAMLEVARRRENARGRVDFVLNESPDLRSFPDNSFDLVYSEIVLMHMEPLYSQGYIQEFLRIVRPGGLVIFQLPEPTRRQALRARLPRALVYAGNRVRTLRRPMMEIYGVPRLEVEQRLRESGGRIVDIEDFGAGGRPDHRYWVMKE